MIIVTGGSSGIGKCLKDKFLLKGKEVLDLSRTNGFDISKHTEIKEYIEKNVREVDIFIHCAGYNQPMKISNINNNFEEWKKHYEINFLSFVFLCSILDGKMKKGGVIIALSSQSADLTRSGWSGYCSSKAALNSFIRNYSDERDDIRIFGFSPSKVYTSMIKKLYPDIKKEECLDPDIVAEEIINLIENSVIDGEIRSYIKLNFLIPPQK